MSNIGKRHHCHPSLLKQIKDHQIEMDPKRKAAEHGEHGKIVKLLETKVGSAAPWDRS